MVCTTKVAIRFVAKAMQQKTRRRGENANCDDATSAGACESWKNLSSRSNRVLVEEVGFGIFRKGRISATFFH